ncbi:hypothetical protein KIPB_006274 [Kipferlia bialata]|uniref:Uncharacterized protein n=1 Tax=Kipferlia bialata TaxID=797122 RepID=A0A9K3GHH4_9EUKA|nr:hypothetical protein KIPB_002657 [Kipferlia bialata]GIQ83188.1 hypothetical protein KIPB_004465 [Kipferlia bialata]GIQ83384.1 hypothetical protein KIPB_004695 [Kipferlia bialata]GIQ84726.1 hypothetical protein KIPB_006274 [Kipferlia bialata]|eukprot:g2657.t1
MRDPALALWFRDCELSDWEEPGSPSESEDVLPCFGINYWSQVGALGSSLNGVEYSSSEEADPLPDPPTPVYSESSDFDLFRIGNDLSEVSGDPIIPEDPAVLLSTRLRLPYSVNTIADRDTVSSDHTVDPYRRSANRTDSDLSNSVIPYTNMVFHTAPYWNTEVSNPSDYEETDDLEVIPIFDGMCDSPSDTDHSSYDYGMEGLFGMQTLESESDYSIGMDELFGD